jgi:glycosyltransferase involved in cell wall biosynthesis
MTPPSVSVVLPVRDGARYLGQAIASILGQTWRDLELLALDDRSADETPAILARAAAADPRVRVLAAPRAGLVAALNHGIGQARGRYVARMDADDVAHRGRLAAQVAALDTSPRLALVGSAWREIGPDGTAGRVVRQPLSAADIRLALRRANPIGHPTVMLRRATVLAAGGYRPAFRLAEDFDLWLRLAERHDLANLAEPLLDYRIHPAQSAWRDVEQRAVSEVAALAAASRRREGLPDGADGEAPADRALLRRLGVAEADIAAGVLGRALGSAKEALSRGQGVAARGFVAVALRQPGLHPRTRLHLHLLRLRAALG